MLFGQLPNGMRYAIKHNSNPTNALSVRLRIGLGSPVEQEDERGIAHLLEHMAFRGSANYSDGDVFRIVARLGLRSGEDANAFTSQDQTVYQFDLPNNDVASLSTSLGILRDIGSNLRLDQQAIDTESGVVLSEERSRASPALDVENASQTFILEGQIAGSRDAIGTIPTLPAATREKLLDFYRANYQPQNATLVVVGAIEVVPVTQ